VLSSALLLFSLYAVELSALAIALALYKRGERSLAEFSASPAGMLGGAAVVVCAAAALTALAVALRGRTRGLRVGAVLAYNLWSVALSLATAEVIIRIFTVNELADSYFANTLLLPRSWQRTVEFNRAALAWAAQHETYLVADPLLGYTIGPNRQSRDYSEVELESRFKQPPIMRADARAPEGEVSYLSSVEGLRSGQRGIALMDQPARHRIAILGDSFTFGLYVEYEQSWGHQLEELLGDGTRVLNFGVDGYGVDQAYLRYQRDAAPWHPDVAILGAISDDLRRTMCVYAFLCFGRAKMPFGKPRFVFDEHRQLALENVPVPEPAAIFSVASIWQVPFVTDDPSYGQRSDWEERFYHKLYLARFLVSRFPRWPRPTPTTSEEAERALNGEIFRAFVDSARAHGTVPILVAFPAAIDFPLSDSPGDGGVSGILAALGLPYIDLRDCVAGVSADERFHQHHYTPVANAAVARCLADPVRAALAEAGRG
jgi:hypothetical protein